MIKMKLMTKKEGGGEGTESSLTHSQEKQSSLVSKCLTKLVKVVPSSFEGSRYVDIVPLVDIFLNLNKDTLAKIGYVYVNSQPSSSMSSPDFPLTSPFEIAVFLQLRLMKSMISMFVSIRLLNPSQWIKCLISCKNNPPFLLLTIVHQQLVQISTDPQQNLIHGTSELVKSFEEVAKNQGWGEVIERIKKYEHSISLTLNTEKDGNADDLAVIGLLKTELIQSPTPIANKSPQKLHHMSVVPQTQAGMKTGGDGSSVDGMITSPPRPNTMGGLPSFSPTKQQQQMEQFNLLQQQIKKQSQNRKSLNLLMNQQENNSNNINNNNNGTGDGYVSTYSFKVIPPLPVVPTPSQNTTSNFTSSSSSSSSIRSHPSSSSSSSSSSSLSTVQLPPFLDDNVTKIPPSSSEQSELMSIFTKTTDPSQTHSAQSDLYFFLKTHPNIDWVPLFISMNKTSSSAVTAAKFNDRMLLFLKRKLLSLYDKDRSNKMVKEEENDPKLGSGNEKITKIDELKSKMLSVKRKVNT
jgi:hypothetical protein